MSSDLLIRNFSEGFHASTFDVSISDTLQSSSLDRAAADTGYVARVAHDLKLRKSRDPCLESNLELFPMVWEFTGGATSTVHYILESWTNQEANHCGLPRSKIRAWALPTHILYLATRVCTHDYEAGYYPRFVLVVVMVYVCIIYEYTISI